MRKLFTSFLSFWMLLSFTMLATSMKAQDVTFKLPTTWEYNAASDVFTFAIKANNEAYNGKVTIIATALDFNQTQWAIFDDMVEVEANGEKQITTDFGGELGLPIGNYVFTVNYEDVYGATQNYVLGACQSKVSKAPSIINRIPITTTTTRPIIVTPSKVVTDESVNVMSAAALNRVSLIDMTGNVVEQKAVADEKKTEVNVSSIAPGIYIVLGQSERSYGVSFLIKL